MGYTSTGEISDITNSWERSVDIVSLILSMTKEDLGGTGPLVGYGVGVKDLGVLKDRVFEGVVLFLETYGGLLLLPITQTFQGEGGDNGLCSRLSIRRLQLSRSSSALLYTVTRQFRVPLCLFVVYISIYMYIFSYMTCTHIFYIFMYLHTCLDLHQIYMNIFIHTHIFTQMYLYLTMYRCGGRFYRRFLKHF